MKNHPSIAGLPIRYDRVVILLMITILPHCVFSQEAVTQVWTHWQTASTSKNYTGTGATGSFASGLSGNSYTYQFGSSVTAPNQQLLDSFQVLGLNYHFLSPTNVKFRRVNNASVTGLRKSLAVEQNSSTTIASGGTAMLVPAYDDSLERIFSIGQLFNVGIDNDFQNAATTNNNNIERVDHLLPAGTHAADATTAGFVVFDRGAGGTHDPFYIAAIKTLDANGDPASYYSAVSVVAGNYGNNAGGSFNYLTLRKNDGDPGLLLMNNTAAQNRDGAFLRLSDLGVANNAVIYGYSLFAPDVVVSPASNLVNYSNATNFPTGSDFSNGGLDQIAVTGLWVTTNAYVVLTETIDNLSAVAVGDEVKLSWNLRYGGTAVIERSGDGVSYAPLRDVGPQLPGQGTATDLQPMKGANFYRIKLVDNEYGVVGYSDVALATIDFPLSDMAPRIYPNPTRGRRFFVSGGILAQDSYLVTIYDSKGRLILSQQRRSGIDAAIVVELPSGLSDGVYWCSLAGRSGKATTRQLLISDQ